MSSQEMSPAGIPVYRHSERTEDYTEAVVDETAIQKISEHIEKHIGKIDAVFHEKISDLIQLDILIVNPTAERNYYTLVTCGMSHLPMTVPEGAEQFKYAELMICLPADWKVSQEDFQVQENYWPIYWLKRLARMPHEYNTFILHGHSIPNGDPAEPFASNTRMSGMLVAVPTTVEDVKSFFTLSLDEDKEIHFFSLVPVYKEEMKYKLKHGVNDLLKKFGKANVNEILNIKRTNVCKKRLF